MENSKMENGVTIREADIHDLQTLLKFEQEVILAERKVELAHEGQYLHDVKRTRGLILDNSSSETYNFDDGRLIFPIPQREMDANPSLVQNSAYTN